METYTKFWLGQSLIRTEELFIPYMPVDSTFTLVDGKNNSTKYLITAYHVVLGDTLTVHIGLRLPS